MQSSAQKKMASPSEKAAPLTDPVDLIALLGRFIGTVVLFIVSGTLLLRHEWRGLAFSAPAMFVMQFLTIRLWRKLRDERVEKEKLRLQKTEDLP
jgi:hypothetical protein